MINDSVNECDIQSWMGKEHAAVLAQKIMNMQLDVFKSRIEVVLEQPFSLWRIGLVWHPRPSLPFSEDL